MNYRSAHILTQLLSLTDLTTGLSLTLKAASGSSSDECHVFLDLAADPFKNVGALVAKAHDNPELLLCGPISSFKEGSKPAKPRWSLLHHLANAEDKDHKMWKFEYLFRKLVGVQYSFDREMPDKRLAGGDTALIQMYDYEVEGKTAEEMATNEYRKSAFKQQRSAAVARIEDADGRKMLNFCEERNFNEALEMIREKPVLANRGPKANTRAFKGPKDVDMQPFRSHGDRASCWDHLVDAIIGDYHSASHLRILQDVIGIVQESIKNVKAGDDQKKIAMTFVDVLEYHGKYHYGSRNPVYDSMGEDLEIDKSSLEKLKSAQGTGSAMILEAIRSLENFRQHLILLTIDTRIESDDTTYDMIKHFQPWNEGKEEECEKRRTDTLIDSESTTDIDCTYPYIFTAYDSVDILSELMDEIQSPSFCLGENIYDTPKEVDEILTDGLQALFGAEEFSKTKHCAEYTSYGHTIQIPGNFKVNDSAGISYNWAPSSKDIKTRSFPSTTSTTQFSSTDSVAAPKELYCQNSYGHIGVIFNLDNKRIQTAAGFKESFGSYSMILGSSTLGCAKETGTWSPMFGEKSRINWTKYDAKEKTWNWHGMWQRFAKNKWNDHIDTNFKRRVEGKEEEKFELSEIILCQLFPSSDDHDDSQASSSTDDTISGIYFNLEDIADQSSRSLFPKGREAWDQSKIDKIKTDMEKIIQILQNGSHLRLYVRDPRLVNFGHLRYKSNAQALEFLREDLAYLVQNGDLKQYTTAEMANEFPKVFYGNYWDPEEKSGFGPA